MNVLDEEEFNTGQAIFVLSIVTISLAFVAYVITIGLNHFV